MEIPSTKCSCLATASARTKKKIILNEKEILNGIQDTFDIVAGWTKLDDIYSDFSMNPSEKFNQNSFDFFALIPLRRRQISYQKFWKMKPNKIDCIGHMKLIFILKMWKMKGKSEMDCFVKIHRYSVRWIWQPSGFSRCQLTASNVM